MPETELPPTLAERFWSHSAGRESEDLPEPERSVAVVRNFLSALERLDVPVLIAMLRRAEVEGDLSYASPEQVRGENLDARAIVFSLGVVLFERLTGRHPFGAENNRPRRVDRIRRGEMGSGVNSFPTIPGGIRTVLVRAMSPFAEERWPDLRELRSALRHATPDEMAPPPKLPGASRDSRDEVTKVVRMPTEFGQELMKVVDNHEPGKGPTPVAQPILGGAATGQRRAKRPSAPPDLESRLPPVPPGAKLPAPAPAPAPPAPPAAAAPMPARAAAVTEPAPSMSTPRPPTATVPDLVLPAKRPRTGVIAIAGAVAGAGITLALVFALRPSGNQTPASAPVAAPTAPLPTTPDPVATRPVDPRPTVTPVVTTPDAAQIAVAPVAPAPDPAPVTPKPVTPPVADPVAPPAMGARIEDRLASAVTSCLETATSNRVFGFSVLFKAGIAGKTYYAGDNKLSSAERTCMSAAIRGLTGDNAPASGDAQFNARAGVAGVTITLRKVLRSQ